MVLVSLASRVVVGMFFPVKLLLYSIIELFKEVIMKVWIRIITTLIYFTFSGSTSWASDGGWGTPFLSDVSSSYRVNGNEFSVDVTYACDYKVNGYIQNLVIEINDSFLHGQSFDLDSDVVIELLRDKKRLLFYRLTESERLEFLAERDLNIKLSSSKSNEGFIPISKFRENRLKEKNIDGVPISELVESGEEFELRLSIDNIQLKRIPVELGFIVEKKFKGIVRSCESNKQIKAKMDESRNQVRRDEKLKSLAGFAILLFLFAFLSLAVYLLNRHNKKKD